MSSDRARLSYDKKQQYRSVVMQQGRVTVEADWNEAQDIVNAAIREETLDIIGSSGTPDDGYRIIETGKLPDPAFDFSVGTGTLYVGGVRSYLNAPVQYSQQQEWLDHSSDPEWVDLPTQAVSEFIYLSLREQEVSAVEDSALLEVALGGPDTAARTRLIQHIVRLGTAATDCSTALAEVATKPGLNFDSQSLRLLSQATLQVSFQNQSAAPNPCEPEVQGGYLGAENQLIRVQISGFNTVTNLYKLVWGFDNASFIYRVNVDSDLKTLRLQSQPVDASHQPRANQAVEVLRSAAQLSNGEYVASATGVVSTLTAPYDPDTQQITLAAPLPPEYLDQSATPRVFLRVWKEALDFTPGIAVPLGTTGLQVTLQTQGNGPFHSGDYWLIAVRSGTPTQVYPPRYLDSPQPPDGPRLWVSPLALITWNADPLNAGALKVLDDCRKPFSPLTQAIPALHVATPPNWTNDDLFPPDRLQTEGLQVTLDGIPVQTSQSLSPATMIVTLEIPVIAASDVPIVPRPNVSVILEGSIAVTNIGDTRSRIEWRPRTDLTALLRVFNVQGTSRVRIVLKGHVIWSVQGAQALYLDGQVFGRLGPNRPDPVIGDGITMTPRIDLAFPSGAGARASDFESWFYLGQVKPPSPTLVSISLNPNSVLAGQGVTGTVTLSNAAPDKDVSVQLSSSDTNVAAVPASVVVAKGQTQGGFQVTTSPSTPRTADVIITATLDTVARTTALHIKVVQVTITPTAITVATGGQTQFGADAFVDGSDTAVTWTSSGGSVTPTSANAAVYTAPNVAGDFTVTATSAIDPTRSASATVHVQLVVSVSISPQQASLNLADTAQFRATVTGTNNQAVNWSVDEGADGGSVSSSGLYTPTLPHTGTFHVRATSVADSSKFDRATVTVRSDVVPVPDVRGDTVTGAAATLRAVGLVVGQLRDFLDRTCNHLGEVVVQTPSPGTQVNQGTAINLSIGKKPPPPFQCP